VHEGTDAELIAAVLGGNVDAFGALVHRYQDTYFRFAVRFLGSHEDADDALQLAFIRAHRSLAACRDRARFRSWFHQIVLNECRTFAARRSRRERRYEADDSILERIPAAQPEARTELEEVQLALNKLDADQREAFLLKHVEDLEYEDMAALTGASVSALKMRVMRARERLRQLLEEAGRTS
jgi:RNA polymerase sigma-70 factor (ECF subfamily)